jgi:hypothetical protein
MVESPPVPHRLHGLTHRRQEQPRFVTLPRLIFPCRLRFHSSALAPSATPGELPGDVIAGILDQSAQVLAQHRWTSGQHETELGQQAADPFDASCALMLETFAQPVYAPVSDL